MSFFLAFELSQGVNAQVAELAKVLSEKPGNEGKWVKPERLHATLVFMGQLSAEEIEKTKIKVASVCADTAQFQLAVSGAGTFVTERAPCVLWLGLSGDLKALHQFQVALSNQFRANEKEFVPHVTLARGKETGQYARLVSQLESWTSSVFTVSSVMLFESRNDTFTIIFSVPFNPRNHLS
jgi:RNA 2',3'-cyclic 3'-phosphodiesterase